MIAWLISLSECVCVCVCVFVCLFVCVCVCVCARAQLENLFKPIVTNTLSFHVGCFPWILEEALDENHNIGIQLLIDESVCFPCILYHI